MTNEEAIEILEELWRYNTTNKFTDDEIRKSLDLAIKALEQQSCEDAISRAYKEGYDEGYDRGYIIGEAQADAWLVIQEHINDILDKISAEIIQMPTISFNANDIYKADVLAIIDKYKAERKDK